MNKYTRRQVRASMLGKALMKTHGRKIIKSLTSALNSSRKSWVTLNTVELSEAMFFAETSQGHDFWSNVHQEHRRNRQH